jgi:hypothetical protein
MLQTWIHRITPGKEGRLQEWLMQLNARADEVRESFAASGVRSEQAFILPGATGAFLVYLSEVDDARRAADVFAKSGLAIDVEHRAVMDECVEEPIGMSPSYSVSID